jgi:hypothetical protein
MFAHDFARVVDVLTFNTKTGHEFYIATVHTNEGELYLARLGGSTRWNKRLADALVGGGYFIGEQYARKCADEMCGIYKDFQPKQVIIRRLGIDDAVSQLNAAFQQAVSEMAKARELSKTQPKRSCYKGVAI